MTRAPTYFIQRQIARDGEQPGGEFRCGLVAVRGLVNLHKDVLRQILGLSGVFEGAIYEVDDGPFVAFHEQFKGVHVPVFNPEHEPCVWIAVVRRHRVVKLPNTVQAARLR